MTSLRICISKLAMVGLMSSAALGAADLRIVDEQLWLDARNTTLRAVLEEFAQLGVYVRMAPGVDGPIDVEYVDVPIMRALASMIGPYSYALVWERLDGPLGDWPRLAEIQIFQSGAREQMIPLLTRRHELIVARSADGTVEFVADEIIIGFAADADPAAIRLLIRDIGGTLVESLPELGIYRIRLPAGSNVPAVVDRLAAHPLVGGVEPNFVYRMPLPTAGEPTATGPARRVMPPRAGTAPVAVLDSGLTLLPELNGWVTGGLNALDPLGDFEDTAGHGTQMALVAAGIVRPAGASDQVSGVPVLPIRAFTDDGVTSNFAQMRSVFYAMDQGARVMNLSWGAPVESEFLRQTTQRAQSSGLVVVASTGNQGTGEAMYPAAYDHVVGVAATLPDGSRWPQSNYGEAVFIAAPGTATFPIGYQGAPGAYAGTSIAAATVSHALGLYFQQNPTATARQAIRALQAAVNPSGTGRDPELGYGVFDATAQQRFLN